MKLKIIEIGDSLGVILPKELLEKIHVEKDDFLFISEISNGCELTVSEPQAWWKKIHGTASDDSSYDEAMRLGKEYRESFRPDAE